MQVRVEYFGRLGEFSGAQDGVVELPGDVRTTDDLRNWLDRDGGFDGALLHPSVQLALGDEILRTPAPLADGDTVAFLPPVGGG